MSKQEQFDYLFKIVLVGDSGVGKTNLLSRFSEGSFSVDSKPTIGVEFTSKTLTIEDQIIKNQIWDTAGQERFRALTNAYYRGSVGAIIVFDLTKSKSFENVQKWLEGILENAEENIQVILVGNKTDLNCREISQEAIHNFASQHNLYYIETSAAQNHNVTEAFTFLIKGIYDKMKELPECEPELTVPNHSADKQTSQKPAPEKPKKASVSQMKKNMKLIEKKTERNKKDCC